MITNVTAAPHQARVTPATSAPRTPPQRCAREIKGNTLHGAVDTQGIHDISLACGHLQRLPHTQGAGAQQEMPHRELLAVRQPGNDERDPCHAKRRQPHKRAAIIAVGERARGKSHHQVRRRTDSKDGADHGFRVRQGEHHPAEDNLLHPQAKMEDHGGEPERLAYPYRVVSAPDARVV